MTKYIILIILFMVTIAGAVEFPYSYTETSGKSTYNEYGQISYPPYPSMSDPSLIGKTIKLESDNIDFDGWKVTVKEFRGAWWVVIGEDHQEYWINPYCIQDFKVVI